MAESVYKVIELIGTSTEPWEKAAQAAIERAAESVRDLRVAEVVEQDLLISEGKVEAYRTKVRRVIQIRGVQRLKMNAVAWRDCSSPSDPARDASLRAVDNERRPGKGCAAPRRFRCTPNFLPNQSIYEIAGTTVHGRSEEQAQAAPGITNGLERHYRRTSTRGRAQPRRAG